MKKLMLLSIVLLIQSGLLNALSWEDIKKTGGEVIQKGEQIAGQTVTDIQRVCNDAYNELQKGFNALMTSEVATAKKNAELAKSSQVVTNVDNAIAGLNNAKAALGNFSQNVGSVLLQGAFALCSGDARTSLENTIRTQVDRATAELNQLIAQLTQAKTSLETSLASACDALYQSIENQVTNLFNAAKNSKVRSVIDNAINALDKIRTTADDILLTSKFAACSPAAQQKIKGQLKNLKGQIYNDYIPRLNQAKAKIGH